MFAKYNLHLKTQTRHVTSRCSSMTCMSKSKISIGNIGDKDYFLMQLPDKEFMQEIRKTRAQFKEKFPELSDIIHEYRKQRTLIELDFWYSKPVPKRCERFLEMEVYSLLENIEDDSQEAKYILQVCHRILEEYLPDKYTTQ